MPEHQTTEQAERERTRDLENSIATIRNVMGAQIWSARNMAKKLEASEKEIARLRIWLELIRDMADPYEGDGTFRRLANDALAGKDALTDVG